MKVRRGIQDITAYAPPIEQRVEQEYLLLDFNESTLPPDRHVAAALKGFIDAGRLRMYPAYRRFLERLARYTATQAGQILLANGSDQAIEVVMRAVLDRGDEVVIPQPAFAIFAHVADVEGARVIAPRYRPDMSFPFEEVLAAVTPRTRLIVVISPNNPTGTTAAPEQVRTLLERFPDVAVLVDEAYYEFTGKTVAAWIGRYPNLVVTRTFSKAFALAGLRLGYALGDAAFIGELHKIRGPYDVNMLAVCAAEASLEHPEAWRAYVREVMTRAKPMVERFLTEHGVAFFQGEANFMLVRPADVDAAYEHLRRNGILVRPQRGVVADMFRLSVGTVADMQRFMDVYARFLSAQPAPPRRAAAP
ncbi:MAG: histidinol-phosphate transaminase [Candidatus Lambdaproteobacteria bacterium]|nr:histidinol-phosphate transaminase [Candidatus Lambdaproteobacteria bacterium]